MEIGAVTFGQGKMVAQSTRLIKPVRTMTIASFRSKTFVHHGHDALANYVVMPNRLEIWAVRKAIPMMQASVVTASEQRG